MPPMAQSIGMLYFFFFAAAHCIGLSVRHFSKRFKLDRGEHLLEAKKTLQSGESGHTATFSILHVLRAFPLHILNVFIWCYENTD
ncbi:hypothetical protein GDO78_012085 [Eleutherodactylus coqui]|uniref:Uncharacterized protein n=1 Tax=Eleutherodactylus coqui TaxID=57060 RepID=A0A8J6F484_ELECQ|nr:hypothetical protein GDO78_012085 [Eleutherodactylus coqui]